MLKLQKLIKYRCARSRVPRGSQEKLARTTDFRLFAERLAQLIPKLSLVALLGLVISSLFVNTFANSDMAQAAEYTTSSGDTTISMSIGGAGENEQVAAGRGNTTYRAHTVTLNAANIEGYVLTISGSPNMTNPSGSSTANTVTAISNANGEVGANITPNTWGYYYGEYNSTNGTSKESVKYKALPAASTTIDSGKPSNQTLTNLTRNLVFAVKFGEDINEGRYYANVNLSISATPKQLLTLADIATMQEMTADICIATPTNYSKQLTDNRGDKKSYWVAKLKDGTCWMTQNLDLDLSGITLTSSDSDISGTWTPNLSSGLWSDTTYTTLRYYDAGKYVYTGGSTTNNCGGQTTGLAGCTSKGWVNVSGGNYAASSDPNFSSVVSGNTYNAHYLVGNYYSWGAATAGTGNSITSGDASSSICPKGWKLPPNSGTGSYANVLSGVGLGAIFSAPYYMVYTGVIDGARLYDAGAQGRYWQSTASSDANAYVLKFDTVLDTTSTAYGRSYGRSVRCVADMENKTPVIPPTTDTIKTVTNLQDVTVEVCENSAIGDTATLRDSRDNNTYTVGRLADGKCWMTQNLRLAGGTTINSTNSDLNGISSYTLPANKTATFTKDNTLQQMRNASDNDYGARYSWCAATANTCQSSGTPIAADTDAASSICPKGWKLPQKDAYSTLNDKSSVWATNSGKNGRWLGATAASSGGGFFPAAGGIYPEYNLAYEGSGGRYWSRTANSTENAYYLRFDSSSSGLSGGGRYPGYSVRCVVEASSSTPVTPPTTADTIKTITKMQEMTSAVCNKSSIGDTATLTDSRDNSTYTVAKLSDGNCWMTQNLRIVNKTITPADSDVSSNFTIPASSTSGFSSNTASNAYYGGDTAYGAYYTWCAATAGTCSSAASGNDASASICPKGWKLPEGGTSGDFQTLYNKWTAATWTTSSGKNGRWLGAASTGAGGAFFPAAGRYGSSSPTGVGSDGRYWSRLASDTGRADILSFDSGTINPTRNYSRNNGMSVRCVAYSS